ncbi:MAG: NAD(P)-dependent oxidoreductase [Leptonema sp. (in: bacteria)]
MILIPDHIFTIWGVDKLIRDFCKINQFDYFVYSLKDLEISLKSKKFIFDKQYFNSKISLFIVPISIKINQDLYLLFNKNILSFGTASTGMDHVDFKFLEESQIPFFGAEGENKDSVVEYTLSVLPHLIEIKRLLQKDIQIGIVGYGRIGSLLGQVLKDLGFSYISVDPFVFPESYHKDLESLKECDIITFHTPLTKEDPYPTLEMIGIEFLKSLKKTHVLINSSRGKIFSKEAYEYAIKNFLCAFDVFISEPPSKAMLDSKRLIIATPHTAGYNWISRFRSVFRVLEKFAIFFSYQFDLEIQNYFPLNFEVQIFDSVLEETHRFKKDPSYFSIRNRYPTRSGIKHQKYNPHWNDFYKILYEYFQNF